jgi:hypothetical protein
MCCAFLLASTFMYAVRQTRLTVRLGMLGWCVQEDLQHWRTKIATNNREWEVGVRVTHWVTQQAPCTASKSCMPCKAKAFVVSGHLCSAHAIQILDAGMDGATAPPAPHIRRFSTT